MTLMGEGTIAFVGAWTKEELIELDKTLNEEKEKNIIKQSNDAELLFKTYLKLRRVLDSRFKVGISHDSVIIKLRTEG